MSLSDTNANGMVMPVSPMNGYGNGGYGFGDGSFWLLILFLFAFMGNGWGNNGYGNAGGEIQRGFDQQSIMGGINGLSAAMNANQVANTAALNSLAMAVQNGCCENRAAVADVKYAVANEGAATRTAIQNGIQTVMDKLCQQEIDALKEQNANLRTQLNLANLSASQTQQTAQIMADNAAQTKALEHYLNPTPIPAYMVQNPNCCTTNYAGCGCNA